MKSNKLILTVLLHFAFSTVCFSQMILVNSSNKDAINSQQIKEIYLGLHKYWDNGQRIAPIHEKLDNIEPFIEKHIGLNKRQFLNYWRRRLFAGRGHPPKEYKTQKEIVEAVLSNPGAIAIIKNRPSKLQKNLKIIKLK